MIACAQGARAGVLSPQTMSPAAAIIGSCSTCVASRMTRRPTSSAMALRPGRSSAAGTLASTLPRRLARSRASTWPPAFTVPRARGRSPVTDSSRRVPGASPRDVKRTRTPSEVTSSLVTRVDGPSMSNFMRKRRRRGARRPAPGAARSPVCAPRPAGSHAGWCGRGRGSSPRARAPSPEPPVPSPAASPCSPPAHLPLETRRAARASPARHPVAMTAASRATAAGDQLGLHERGGCAGAVGVSIIYLSRSGPSRCGSR